MASDAGKYSRMTQKTTKLHQKILENRYEGIHLNLNLYQIDLEFCYEY